MQLSVAQPQTERGSTDNCAVKCTVYMGKLKMANTSMRIERRQLEMTDVIFRLFKKTFGVARGLLCVVDITKS